MRAIGRPVRGRTAFRRIVVALATGVLLTGVAGAGMVVSPLGGNGDGGTGGGPSGGRPEPVPDVPAAATAGVPLDPVTGAPRPAALPPLDGGLFYVGADAGDIAPRDPRWQTSGCSAWAAGQPDSAGAETVIRRLAAGTVPPGWPKSEHCVYLGGYGIGPARPATGVDHFNGVKVRSLAISNGPQTVVWQMVDLVGFFSTYRSDVCTPGCGILDIRRTLAERTGIPVANLAVGSTHTHGGADGYGAWGGLPDWYRAQLRDDIVESAERALAALQPATIEVGSVDARAFNGERRDTYFSANDYGLVWLQAKTVPTKKKAQPEVVATLVNYGAHPTVLSAQPVMHGDWPATAAKAIGDRLGGVGLVFEGGLGNVSPSRPRNAEADLDGDGARNRMDDVIQHGRDFAEFLAADVLRGGHRLPSSAVTAASVPVVHPATNMPLVGGALGGVLDRAFTPGGDGADGPGVYRGGKHAARACTTSGPVQVKTEVSAFRVGDLTVVTGPGELFSGITNAVKARVRHRAFEGGQTMVFAQTQDSLGYIIQSFEVDAAGGVGSATGAVEYEETFMLDRCFGDHVLDAQLQAAAAL